MLKNDREHCPCAATLRRIVSLGRSPRRNRDGWLWGAAGRPEDRVSVVAGLRQSLTDEIVHAAGVAFSGRTKRESPRL